MPLKRLIDRAMYKNAMFRCFMFLLIILLFLNSFFFTNPYFTKFSFKFHSKPNIASAAIEDVGSFNVNGTQCLSHNFSNSSTFDYSSVHFSINSGNITPHSIPFIMRSTHLEDLLVRGFRGTNITVAVLSSGLTNYSIFYNRSLANIDFAFNSTGAQDYNGLGTFIFELLLNSKFGLCPNITFINVRVMDISTNSLWLENGIYAALEFQPDIILLGTNFLGHEADNVSQAIHHATSQGVLVISPSGDYGPSYQSISGGALNYDALCVGGAQHSYATLPYTYDYKDYYVPSFISRGPNSLGLYAPQIVAPSSIMLNGYSLISHANLSFPLINSTQSSIVSAAIVTAGIADILSALKSDGFDNISPDLIKSALIATAIPLNDAFANDCGNGLVNFYDAYKLIKSVLLTNSSFYTIFPRHLLTPPFVYYNDTTKQYFAFCYQRVPINVFVYSYSPLAEHSIAINNLDFIYQDSTSIRFRGNFSAFSGILVFRQSFIISPYYWHTISVAVEINNDTLTSFLVVKYPSLKVLFDDTHNTDGYYFNDSLQGNYWSLANNFARNNIAIYPLSSSPISIDNSDLIILADPEKAFSIDEVAQYRSYLSSGGNIFFIAGDQEFESFNLSTTETYLHSEPTNDSNLFSLTSSIGLISPLTSITEKELAKPIISNLVDPYTFYFVKPLHIDYFYFNSSFINGLKLDEKLLSLVAFNGYNIILNPRDTSSEVIMATDWMHQRGVLFAKTKVGAGNLIVSSTETFWTTEGQYFSQLLLGDQYYDYYNLFLILLHILEEQKYSIKINPLSVSMLSSQYSLKIIIEGISNISIINITATGYLPSLNTTTVGKLVRVSSSLYVTFTLPLFYSGILELFILIKPVGHISSLIYYSATITLMPIMYDIFVATAIILVIILIVFTTRTKLAFIHKLTFYSKRIYCPNCKLPIRRNNDYCEFCHVKIILSKKSDKNE